MGTAEKIERPFYEPGWYRDLSNEEYHGSFGFSSSQIKKLIEQTPAHLLHSFSERKEPTANMQLGTAVHSLVLEPDKFENDIAVAPVVNKRTNAGKAEWAEFVEENAGKTIITPGQYEQAQRMAESVLAQPMAAALLQDVIVESSVYWWYRTMDADDDTKFKTMLKVRPDVICRNHPVLIDLKTTADATMTEFAKSIQKFYYHVSAAMYLEGVNQCKPLLEELGHFAYTKFVFICVESEAPYLANVYELDAGALDLGKTIYRRALHDLKRGQENNWPGFPEEIRVIELPGWASRAHIV